jgi:hypothetical protein
VQQSQFNMTIDRIKQPNIINDKYYNSDYIHKVFEGNDESEINKVKEIHNLSDEQIEIFSYYAKMRKEVVGYMGEKIHKRKSENSLATKDELMIGCYMEAIEPQVKEAVIEMNKKGYATEYSGFHNFNSQVIKFKTEKKVNILLEQIEEKYKEIGIEIKVDQESIKIIFSKKISLEEIKKIWDEIATFLPDLGGPAKVESIARKKFLEIQELIKSGKRKSYYK